MRRFALLLSLLVFSILSMLEEYSLVVVVVDDVFNENSFGDEEGKEAHRRGELMGVGVVQLNDGDVAAAHRIVIRSSRRELPWCCVIVSFDIT